MHVSACMRRVLGTRVWPLQHCIKNFRTALIGAKEDPSVKGSRLIPIEVVNDKGELQYITANASCLVEAYKFQEM